jgi:hypothetical protein
VCGCVCLCVCVCGRVCVVCVRRWSSQCRRPDPCSDQCSHQSTDAQISAQMLRPVCVGVGVCVCVCVCVGVCLCVCVSVCVCVCLCVLCVRSSVHSALVRLVVLRMRTIEVKLVGCSECHSVWVCSWSTFWLSSCQQGNALMFVGRLWISSDPLICKMTLHVVTNNAASLPTVLTKCLNSWHSPSWTFLQLTNSKNAIFDRFQRSQNDHFWASFLGCLDFWKKNDEFTKT